MSRARALFSTLRPTLFPSSNTTLASQMFSTKPSLDGGSPKPSLPGGGGEAESDDKGGPIKRYLEMTAALLYVQFANSTVLHQVDLPWLISRVPGCPPISEWHILPTIANGGTLSSMVYGAPLATAAGSVTTAVMGVLKFITDRKKDKAAKVPVPAPAPAEEVGKGLAAEEAKMIKKTVNVFKNSKNIVTRNTVSISGGSVYF